MSTKKDDKRYQELLARAAIPKDLRWEYLAQRKHLKATIKGSQNTFWATLFGSGGAGGAYSWMEPGFLDSVSGVAIASVVLVLLLAFRIFTSRRIRDAQQELEDLERYLEDLAAVAQESPGGRPVVQ